MKSVRDAIVTGLLVLAMTAATIAVFRAVAGPVPANGVWLASLAVTMGVATLLPGPKRGLSRGAIHATVVAAAGSMACFAAVPAAPATILAAIAGLWVLALFVGGLKGAIAAIAPAASGIVAFMLLAAAAGAPIWLGPLAEVAGHAAVIDAVVAVSPLTHLAGALSYDYLHGAWFYRHSAMAYLRFAYPDPWLSALVLTVLGSILHLATRRTGRELRP